jgi:rhamnosyltransferase
MAPQADGKDGGPRSLATGILLGSGSENGRRLQIRSMRVLAHIHTFNDADIIDATIAAVLRQTRPVDGIIVVDNGSTDDTLERPSVNHVAVLRHPENRGTSGAVYSGFRFALERDYDWIWVFDADSVPEPDALKTLLDLYTGWPRSLQDETGFLACLPHNLQDGLPLHGGLFTRHGLAPARPASGERYYRCNFTIWSGCLYRLAAVRQIGLPNPDYVLDWGEYEYAYRVMKAGYKAFIHIDAVLQHNIRGYTSVNPSEVKLGPATSAVHEFPPIRCYYTCRNMFYFALYDFAEGRFGLLRSMGWRVLLLPVSFLLRPRTHGEQILACFRGIWHGATGNIAARY